MRVKTDFADCHGMQVLQPANARLGDFEVKGVGVDNLLDVDLAVVGLEDLRSWVELLDQVKDAGEIGLRDLHISCLISTCVDTAMRPVVGHTMSTLLSTITSANSIWSTMRSDTVRSSSGTTSSRLEESRSLVWKSLKIVKASITVTVVSRRANLSTPPASALQTPCQSIRSFLCP